MPKRLYSETRTGNLYTVRSLTKKKARMTPKLPMASLPRAVIPETKWIDIVGTGTSPFITAPLLINQGSGREQRNGNKVFIRTIDVSVTMDSLFNGTARVSVVIPKNSTITPIALGVGLRYSQDEYFILHDSLISGKDKTCLRLRLPVNKTQQYFSPTPGTIPNTNYLYVLVNGSAAAALPTISYRAYFTDA